MICRFLPVFAVLALLSAPVQAAGEIEIVAPVLRLPVLAGGNGAVFLTILNHGPADRLIGASLPGTRATELHTHQHDGGVMRMRPVQAIAIPAQGQAELRPGGDHIMAIGLSPAPAVGESVPLVLTFEHAGPLEIAVPARPATE